jgi:hypothetical protein
VLYFQADTLLLSNALGEQACMAEESYITLSNNKRFLRAVKVLRVLKIIRLLKAIKVVE